MTIRYLQLAAGAIVLTCTACVTVPPPPTPVASYVVPPPQTAPQAMTQNCREFQQTVVIDGKSQSATGTECQQPDGSWQVVNAPPVAAAPPPSTVVVPYAAYPPPPPSYVYYPPYAGPYYGPPVALGLRFGFGGRR